MRITLTEATAAKTLPQLINEFITRKKADGLRDRTLRDYYKELSKFAATTSSLDENDLRHAVVNYFAAIPDTSAAIYNRPYGCLKSFFNWCVDNEYLTYNPIVKEKLKKRGDDSDINAASIDDVKRLLKACNRSSFTGLRNYTMILLMVDTGIRTSEITRLTPNDYDKGNRTITIVRQTAKTKKKRILYLSDGVANSLNYYLNSLPKTIPYIFPSRDANPLSTNELAREFRKLSNAANVKITPYQLRHTFATYFVANGGNVFILQKLMGHSDIKMTLRYTDISEEQKQESHKAYTPANLITQRLA